MLVKSFNKDNLKVNIFDTRKNMGEQASKEFAELMIALQEVKEEINIIFAAAPSQNDFLLALENEKGIDWTKVNVFHMDEYVGLDINCPQSFAKFVKNNVADRFPVKAFYPINGAALSSEEQCYEYTRLLKEHPIDIVCMGIGENGHIAFNDPGVADFFDIESIKIAKLDQTCRKQQVNDKCFPDLDSVPRFAYTLTVPTLLRGKALFCIVPAATKKDAVTKTINGDVVDTCPASILRIHKNARLYLDSDSGKDLL